MVDSKRKEYEDIKLEIASLKIILGTFSTKVNTFDDVKETIQKRYEYLMELSKDNCSKNNSGLSIGGSK